MKPSNSFLTPSEAAELAECTVRHINNLITQGKLSALKEGGRYFIDKSEFFRVFPRAYKQEQIGITEKKKGEHERIKSENAFIKEMLAMKEKEIEFLKNQIETYNIEKTKMLDAIASHARLLEHKESKAIGKKRRKFWPFKGRHS